MTRDEFVASVLAYAERLALPLRVAQHHCDLIRDLAENHEGAENVIKELPNTFQAQTNSRSKGTVRNSVWGRA